MKRLAIIRGGVAIALMLGIVVAVASSAEASPSGQLGAYMREGLSLKQAQVALATQAQVEAAELPARLEKALGASFAGMWFEPTTGKFCIGVVSSASRRPAEQVVARTDLASVVSYVSVRSTWTKLISAQGEWNFKLAHLGGRQFSTGLTASNNAVSVTLSSSVSEHERALLEREAAGSRVNVSIAVVPPQALAARPDNSQCEFKSEEAYCSKPIAAGVLITTLNTAEPPGDYCTAGPLAILSNPATLAAELETFLITAGHCTEGKTKWFTSTHPGKETKEIGSTVFSLNDLGGDYGDIAIGPNWLETGTTPALAQITHYQDNGLREARSVLGEAASVQNESFCKQGATSAEQCGTIMAVDMLVEFESEDGDDVDVDGLVVTTACSEKGDSGGPYATLPVGNSVDILGTEVGGLTDQTCSGLFCSDCLSYYEPIKTSLTGLGLTLLTTANQTRHSTRHPLFLTESGKELLFSGTNPAGTTPTLRARNAGVLGTITCEKVLVDGFALPKSPLAHRIKVEFHTKCKQKVGSSESTCVEPIVVKTSLAELGSVLGNKTVGILLIPSDGTKVFAKTSCGGLETTVEGTIVGEIPEINKKLENQYNSERSESEQVFEAAGKNTENQAVTAIELLGVSMTGDELLVSGFFGGKASQEVIAVLKGDGKIEICTKEPQTCP